VNQCTDVSDLERLCLCGYGCEHQPMNRQLRGWLRTAWAGSVKQCCELERLNQCIDVSDLERLCLCGNACEHQPLKWQLRDGCELPGLDRCDNNASTLSGLTSAGLAINLSE